MMLKHKDRNIKKKNNMMARIWGGTALVALLIVGGALFVASSHKKLVRDILVSSEKTQDSLVKKEMLKPSGSQGSEIRSAELIKKSTYPQLLLDNLAGTLKLSVPFLKIRNKIPLEYTCYRNNISPKMNWEGAPAGTKSFVVFLEKKSVDKTDKKEPFVNWILFNISGEAAGLSENQPKSPALKSGAKHANSDHNNIGYIGPCESKGTFTYALRVFALDTALDLNPFVPKYDLIRAMNGHIIDAAEQEFIHYYRL